MNELNEKKYQNTINNIDWTELHRAMVMSDYGMGVWIYEDGTIDFQTSGTLPGKNNTVIAMFTAWGANISENDYLEGWGEWDREEDTFLTDDGRTLTTEEAITEAINEGEYHTQIEQWKESIRESIEEDEEAEDYEKLQREE